MGHIKTFKKERDTEREREALILCVSLASKHRMCPKPKSASTLSQLRAIIGGSVRTIGVYISTTSNLLQVQGLPSFREEHCIVCK